MATVWTVIGIVVAAIAVLLVVKYFTGNNKSISEKTPSEKISYTIAMKIDKALSDFANGIRTFDAVKDEIIRCLDEAQHNLRNDYVTYVKNMVTARETYKSVIENADNNIPKIKATAKTLKDKYNNTQNPADKELATRYVSRMISMQNVRDNAQKKYDTIVAEIEGAQYLYELEKMKLEDKRLDIITKTCAPDISSTISSFNIDELTSEFTSKLKEKEIAKEVNSIVNNSDNTVNVSDVNSDEVDSVFNSL